MNSSVFMIYGLRWLKLWTTVTLSPPGDRLLKCYICLLSINLNNCVYNITYMTYNLKYVDQAFLLPMEHEGRESIL